MTSRYLGVWREGTVWRAAVWRRQANYDLGEFPTAEEAAIAHDVKARALFGDGARLNFPPDAASPPPPPVNGTVERQRLIRAGLLTPANIVRERVTPLRFGRSALPMDDAGRAAAAQAIARGPRPNDVAPHNGHIAALVAALHE